MHNLKSTKLLNRRSKLNSPKLAEESHMMEDNNHSSGVSLFSFFQVERFSVYSHTNPYISPIVQHNHIAE